MNQLSSGSIHNSVYDGHTRILAGDHLRSLVGDWFQYRVRAEDSFGAVGVFKTDADGETHWSYYPDRSTLAMGVRAVELSPEKYVVAWMDRGSNIAKTHVVLYHRPSETIRWHVGYNNFTLTGLTRERGNTVLVFGSGLRTGTWVAKLAADGSEKWRYTHDPFTFESVRPVPSGFLQWGTAHDDGQPTGSNVRLLDTDRREQWTLSYDEPNTVLESVAPVDSGYLALNRGGEGFWATKLTETGEISWKRLFTVDPSRPHEPRGAVATTDNFVVIGQFRTDEDDDGWIATIERRHH